jgi:hypothetical protein
MTRSLVASPLSPRVSAIRTVVGMPSVVIRLGTLQAIFTSVR